RNPEHSRVFHFRSKPRLIRHECAGIVPAHRYQRPSVILARQEYVDFIATHRPNFCFPQLVRLRMESEPISVTMTIGINLGLHAGLADKWIVRRNTAIISQSQNLADMIVEGLCFHAEAIAVSSVTTQSIAVANCDVERFIGPEHDPSSEVAPGFPCI